MSYVKLIGQKVSDGSFAEVKLTDSNSIYTSEKVVNLGSEANFFDASGLNTGTATPAFDISNYSYITVLWRDTTLSWSMITVQMSFDNSTWYNMGPGDGNLNRTQGTVDNTKYYASASGTTHGMKYIRFYNDSGGAVLSGITISIVGI